MPHALTAAAIDQAAKKAAKLHYELVKLMLHNGESGEVATIINGGHLQPEKRVKVKGKGFSVGVGHVERIEG